MSTPREYHEDFGRASEPGPGGVRGFAVVMAIVFALVSIYFSDRWWVGVSLLLVLLLPTLAWLAPRNLESLNNGWHRLGILMGRVVSPLIMGLIFFGVVTPIGLLRRLMGKDSLAQSIEPTQSSYWIERHPPGPNPEDIRRQF